MGAKEIERATEEGRKEKDREGFATLVISEFDQGGKGKLWTCVVTREGSKEQEGEGGQKVFPSFYHKCRGCKVWSPQRT